MNNKVLVIGDLHLGVNKNNPVFHKISLEYAHWIKNICITNNLDTIVQLGDIFHDRKSISVNTLDCANDFFTILEDFKIHIVVGNHDVVFNDTTDVNSLKIFNRWPNITIHEKVTSIEDVCFCGWATPLQDIPDNQKVIFGHFDIVGFEIGGGTLSEHGFNGSELMNKAPLVMTGHYHKAQVRNYAKNGQNRVLLYTGSCFQLDWGASGEDKYAYILDIDTQKYISLRNTVSPRFEYISNVNDLEKVKNNFVAFTCKNEEYDSISESLIKNNALGIKFIKEELTSSVTEFVENLEKEDMKLSGIHVPDLIREIISQSSEYTDDEKQRIITKGIEMYESVASSIDS